MRIEACRDTGTAVPAVLEGECGEGGEGERAGAGRAGGVLKADKRAPRAGPLSLGKNLQKLSKKIKKHLTGDKSCDILISSKGYWTK